MVLDKLEWIPLTAYAIFRNKRRTFAMISGIILGVTILTGILIYSSVLKQQNFQSVVENAAYEVRFDRLDNETLADLTKLENLIGDDDRVLDTTIMAQQPQDGQEFSYIPSLQFDDEDEEVNPGDMGPGGFSLRAPVFVETDYTDTLIGRKFKNNIDGEFNLEGGNKTVISRTLASQKQLEVGDRLPWVNLTITQIKNSNFFPTAFMNSIQNVTIAGIYEEDAAEGGLFASLFAIDEVYFSIDVLEQLDQINELITNELGYFIAVKIDETKFSVDDPESMNEEINQFINQIAKLGEELDMEVDGNNEIAFLLLPFQFSSFFITLFDVLLAAPVVILSLYLLFFGLEMSLEERRREIAIKKVQGADSKQIYSELRNEAILLFVIGSVIGYILGIIGAWVISSAIGFMRIAIGTQDDFLDFFKLDTSAIMWSSIIVGGILTLQILRQGRGFIESEVSESVQKFEGKKETFMKRNKIDVVLFIIGIMGIILSLLEHQFDVDLNLNLFVSIIINGLGPFFLWIGGAMIGARVTKFIPIKLEPIFLSLPSFKDISRIIRSGLRRRGDTDRLAIIIVLTLSIATLAAAQGNTEFHHIQRTIEYEVGADMQVSFGEPLDYQGDLLTIEGVEEVLAISRSDSFRVLTGTFSAAGIDVDKELQNIKDGDPIGIWHDDSFNDLTAQEALQLLKDNPNGVFVTRNINYLLDTEIDDVLKLKVLLDADPDAEPEPIDDVKVLGTYDHIPGGILGSIFFTSNDMVQKINALADGENIDAYQGDPIVAETYLIKTTYGADITDDQINRMKAEFAQIQNYNTMRSTYGEINNEETLIGSFGVSGLLSLNFLVAVVASLISTFAFSAILMERRRREFAVLRAIGARKSQIYKLALGENTMMVLTAVVWGSIIGLGITFQFNGVFELFGAFLGAGPLDRIVMFPFSTVSFIGIGATLGMLLATMISVRSAANQDLSIATRVL
ncbi:MAG: ABC transporter permease [Candidatus Heimdallarchaeota archaeon]|nr:ABC transporter permease [Candidatus Heimdallarchaeota archaeon]